MSHAPSSALVWEDVKGQTWLSYNDPRYIANRHGIRECGDAVQRTTAALETLAESAARP